jgi:hypothetical protein
MLVPASPSWPVDLSRCHGSLLPHSPHGYVAGVCDGRAPGWGLHRGAGAGVAFTGTGGGRRDSRWAVRARRGGRARRGVRVIRARRGITVGWGWAAGRVIRGGLVSQRGRRGPVSRRGDRKRGLSRRGRRGDAGWFRGEGITGGWEARAGFVARGSQAGRIVGGGSLHLGLNSCRDFDGTQ